MKVPACVALSFILIGTGFVSFTNGEMFTALIHMEGLLDLERNLLGQLNDYISKEKER